MFAGVDVGGTNTDAVLMDGSRLAGAVKVPTTPDVTSGIAAALAQLLQQLPSGRRTGAVAAVMVGTTHFTNALLEHKGLSPTAVIRLALPATQLLPPLVDWPEALREAIGGLTYMVGGGHEFDGREIAPLDRPALREIARELGRQGVDSVALCGVFSPVNPAHELAAADLLREERPGLQVSLSHESGRMGLLERENAAALNACLGPLALRTIRGMEEALGQLGINAPLFMSQNDGTLMDMDFAARFPALTISSGPTNSMRGAAYLSGISDGIVVDVGGTSTDVGALVRGFPRESEVAVRLAGVRTNLRSPDTLSIALGGGTVVRREPWQMGPDSVGYRLQQEALVFGGQTLTATDLAVADGRAAVGDRAAVDGLSPSLVERAMAEIQERVETAVDRVKLSSGDVPVALVGGGSILLGDRLAGASRVVRPEHAGVANAIGAAIAQVGGQVERVYSLDGRERSEAVADCRAAAIQRAVAAGADTASVTVVEVEEVPLTYLPSNATRVRVKAVGNLNPARLGAGGRD